MEHARSAPAVYRLAIAICLLLQAAQGASVVRLYPVDDTTRDPSFRTFVKRLRSAVEARDAKALRKLVDAEVVVGSGKDDTGWAKFVAKWHPEDENSEVWTALADMISLGFVREHPSLFVSPYLVWRFPRELSMEGHLVVVRDKAALRVEPSPNALATALLSFDIVERLGPSRHGEDMVEWIPVRTLEGQTGYVNARDVMSPLMPRAQFALRRGHWALVALEGPDQ